MFLDAFAIVAILKRAERHAHLVGHILVGHMEDARDLSTSGLSVLEAVLALHRIDGIPAQLNLGDCFSYGCSQTQGVPPLFVGNDFPDRHRLRHEVNALWSERILG